MGTPDSGTANLARDLANGKITLAEALARTRNRVAKAFILKYKNVAIAYEFTLDITEENSITPNVDFVGALTHRTVTFGLSATNDLSRQNVYHFYLTDLLGSLVDDPQIACDRAEDRENIEFPIAGRIGVDKQVSTFFNLNELNHLSVSGLSGLDLNKLPTLAVIYNFQTTISGSATAPKVTVTPAGKGYNPKEFGVGASVSRKDFHRAIISFALPLDGKAPSLAYVPPGITLDPAFAGAMARAKTPQESEALRAIADTKVNQYLSRSPQ
ncbi:hypothetical protein [Methylobacterium planeticum]|uniref:Uncharacterized protein n=1 Tax=Methylobacterium planeticum TaxID=2615211 RepID=A0A6N6MGM8_9HYPH|nr:hypothetical protein [Methylobacterium planeticum]KAB1068584.1 hypothetical protein F6X51_26670 [Methylobacterium planeticum]